MYGFEATTFYSCMLPRSSLELASLLSVINKNIYLCLDHPHVDSCGQWRTKEKTAEVGFSCCWLVNGLRSKPKGKGGAGGTLLVYCGLVLWATTLVQEEVAVRGLDLGKR